VGLAVRRNLDYGRHWQIGVSAWNLNTPDVSFKDNARVNLQQRLALHGSYCVIIDDEWDIIPSSRIMVQGPYQEILLGSRFRYTWAYSALEKRRAYLGLFSRLEDGAFITAGLENNEWALGLSYDINLSSLEIASRNRGAFEVTAVYIFDVFDEVRVLHKKCIDIL
ncbi:MAG: type IX secretion system membrane protein PorP/SprF, partial [Flavobacteriales bacterium]|nr:type IX secretion system membrane protein PorP/SprF [Flavobacteriales bacterium]